MTHISDLTFIVLMSVPFHNDTILSVTIAEFYNLKSGTVEARASFFFIYFVELFITYYCFVDIGSFCYHKTCK